MKNSISFSPGWQMLLGATLIIVPTGIMTFFFANNGTNNQDFRNIMEFVMGVLFPLVMIVLIGGMVLLYRGASQMLYKDEPIPSMFSQKSRMGWFMNLLNALIFAFLAATAWMSGLHLSTPFTILYLGVAIALGSVIQRRMYPNNSWPTAMIGDPALAPKDEREHKILTEAGQTALGISFLVMGAAITLLVVAPKPSLISTLYLFISLASFQRGFYGMMAWKKGLR